MNLKILALVTFSLFPFFGQAQDTIIIYPAYKEDTIEALQNLFRRKRKIMRTKAAVITCVADLFILKMWSQPGSPIQAVPPGSTIHPTTYIFLGLGSFIAANAIVENSRYGNKALRTLLNDYNAGKKLPLKIKSKIKNRDFR